MFLIPFVFVFFFFLYLENHHVTNRGFHRVFFGGEKRNLRHIFRGVSKDRVLFRRVPRYYRQDYGPGVNSIPYTLPNLLSCPFRLGASASWAVACNKTYKKLDTCRGHVAKPELKFLISLFWNIWKYGGQLRCRDDIGNKVQLDFRCSFNTKELWLCYIIIFFTSSFFLYKENYCITLQHLKYSI